MTADQYALPLTSGTPGAEADRAVSAGAGAVDETQAADEAQAVRNSIRRAARGMAHHEAEDALGRAQAEVAGGEDGDEDGPVSPAVEEWERIVDLLTTHAGPYDPDSDPFVQGELTAQANREAARRTDGDANDADAGEDSARDSLLRSLARTGVQGGAGGGNEPVVDRIVQADPAAALAVGRWLDDAFAAGRAAG
ncbi:hypothetical protein [Streptomyces sp. H39-S7]|uniref:hypothetical protein n=1 Tax=Streptomyces sp. H39-S7 TaxID=3004357 RepID=UPI0022AE7D9F|nr:hypothetical protein [Streptomyces sp. H39-S7]MCZ4124813.1 hypothetical protein [Streptomyces sp. H39-S7]